MAKQKQEMTTYHIQRKGGRDQRVTVPSSWKVTFGPLNPGGKGFNGSEHLALRFWEAANKQRMVITDVLCFRDAGIKVEEKRTSVKQQTLTKNTSHGDKQVVVEGRVEEWVNPDAPQQDALMTPDANARINRIKAELFAAAPEIPTKARAALKGDNA